MEDNEHGVKIFSEDNKNNICARPTLRLAEGVFLPKMKTMMINNTNAWCQLVYKSHLFFSLK